MNLEQQTQMLIDQAPQDGQTPAAIRAIAPVLKQVAQRLQHSQYYLLQTPDQRWQTTTLRHRTQPELEKTVVYAYARREDAATHVGKASHLLAVPQPVLSLLLQVLALQGVDSIIFFDYPGDLDTGVEVFCQEIQMLVHQQLQQTVQPPRQPIPPDLA